MEINRKKIYSSPCEKEELVVASLSTSMIVKTTLTQVPIAHLPEESTKIHWSHILVISAKEDDDVKD